MPTTRPGGRRTWPPSASPRALRRRLSSSWAPAPASSAPTPPRAASASRRSPATSTPRRSACARDSSTASSRSPRWTQPRSSALARRERAGGVLSPGTDGPVRVAAEVAAALGLPHSARSRHRRARDRQARAARARSTARACRIRPGARTGRACPPGARVVVKPAAAQGQRGLEIVEPGGDLGGGRRGRARRPRATAVRCARSSSRAPSSRSMRSSTRPLRAAHGHRPRARAGIRRRDRPSLSRRSTTPLALVAAAEAACRALGLTSGPTYTQVLLAPDGPRVMEVAARLGGGHDGELCAAALGVDLSAAAVRAALGEAPGSLGRSERPRRRRALPDRARRTPRVRRGLGRGACAARRRARLRLPRPGPQIGPLLRGPDRAGFVLATGATREAAEDAAREAEAAIRFASSSHAVAPGDEAALGAERFLAPGETVVRALVAVAKGPSHYIDGVPQTAARRRGARGDGDGRRRASLAPQVGLVLTTRRTAHAPDLDVVRLRARGRAAGAARRRAARRRRRDRRAPPVVPPDDHRDGGGESVRLDANSLACGKELAEALVRVRDDAHAPGEAAEPGAPAS